MLGLSQVTRRRHARSVMALAAAAAVIGGATAARAGILATATRNNGFATTAATAVVMPLTDSNATALTFSTTAPRQAVVITYNAACAAIGSSAGARLSVTILVDGKPADPNAGSSFALCTSATAATTEIDNGSVRQSVAAPAKAGAHSVSVVAQGVGTLEWRLDYTSLVVWR